MNNNSKVRVGFKKTHPDAQLPTKNHNSDAGMDLYAVEDTVINGWDTVKLLEENSTDTVVPVGLSLAGISSGYFLTVACRSGLGFKHGLSVHNGIIDQDYRGDLGILMRNNTNTDYHVKKGDRIAQLIILPSYTAQIIESDTEASERGDDGFGSSGK